MDNELSEREIDKNDEIQESAYEAGSKDGYTAGTQSGWENGRKDLVKQLIKELPEENKTTYQESASEGEDGEIKGYNQYRAEIIKLLESKL